MPTYPNRPTSPNRSTLAYRTGPIPPISQQRQFLPNDMSRPVAGNPYQLVGSRPRVADGPFAGGNNIGLNGDAVGETMIERFERERNGRLGLRSSSFGLPPESDQFSYPPAHGVNMPTASAAVDMSQYVPGLRSHEIQRRDFIKDPDHVVGFNPAPAAGQFNHSAFGQDPRSAYRVPQSSGLVPPSPGYPPPILNSRIPGNPIDLSRPPEQMDEPQWRFTAEPEGPSNYKFMMDRFGAMSRSRDALVRRNLEQAGGVRPKVDYENMSPSLYERGLTPQQAAYVDNDLPQSPLTNTRFVGRMAETPRDLSGSNGVRYGEIRPGVPLAYIPQHQSDGSIGQSRFVEGTERTGSYGTMRVERNPLTGGIALIGGGRPIRDENVDGQESGPYASRQELYARQQARSQAYKDTRAQRAYGRNPRLANAPAVADMRDRRSDVEYERTKARRRDAMLEQVQMEALKQQLKGMTPQQLEEFLGGFAGRPSTGEVSAKKAAEFRKRKTEEDRAARTKKVVGALNGILEGPSESILNGAFRNKGF